MRARGFETTKCVPSAPRYDEGWQAPQRKYEIRLLESDGRTVGVYAFSCSDDEKAKARIFHITEPYSQFEIWRGMECIAKGSRFICGSYPPELPREVLNDQTYS